MSGGSRGRVLVTSAQERFGLAACRSLAAAGYSVSAAADLTPAVAHWSRSSSASYVVPDPKQGAGAFVTALEEIVTRTEHAVLLPATDAALLAVSRRRDRLEPLVRLGLPPHEVVEASTDKVRLTAAGQAAGLETPATIVCHTIDDGRAAARELGFPVVIKPRRTVFEAGGALRQLGSAHAADAAELDDLIGQFGSPFLVQRAQPGSVYSAAGIRTPEGIPALAFARYIRTWPPEAGNVAFAETTDPPAGLRERIDALLGELGWTGIWELEMVGDGHSFHAIDLNPRLYGSLALATRAGAPLAAMFCDWVLGEAIPHVTARAGVRYRWEDADLRYAIQRLRERRLRDVAGAIRPRRNVAHAHFSLRDPMPLAARAVDLFRRRRAHRAGT